MAEALELALDGPSGPRTVRVSSPDKPYFPEMGVTKADVVRYFLAVGDGLLGALRDRPTALERWPGGVYPGAKLAIWQGAPGDGFYQKRLPRGAPDWVRAAQIDFADGVYAAGIWPTETAVLAWAANLGTLTFHPWAARLPDVDHPDRLTVDLDPQPGTGFHDAVRVAVELRGLLAELGMLGFPKTSGGRGVHVYVAIEPRWTFEQVRRGLIALGRELVRRMPREVTLDWWKEERGVRVFVDYNQMAPGRTMASAYSIRPTPRATVSAPVTWDELTAVVPEDFDVTTMPVRFAQVGDLHAGLAGQGCSIQPLLELADRDERDGAGGDLPYPPSFPKVPGEPKRVQPSRARTRP